jgi:hypothetical protein
MRLFGLVLFVAAALGISGCNHTTDETSVPEQPAGGDGGSAGGY